jgi:bis(5'-nucleosyl)-tetraphosphatase (symmetrical)
VAIYAIGDVQGCFAELQQLVQKIRFRADCDQLWFCGDLIARGPDSLATLRWIRDLGDNAITVLGNHDLNFLAHLAGYGRIQAADKLEALLQAPDRDALANWLSERPLLHYDQARDTLLVHAGLSPAWDLGMALQNARQVEQLLRHHPEQLWPIMYGNTPDAWADCQSETEKIRYSINACTRMRYCYLDGRLELKEKGEISHNPALIPWFELWRHKSHPQLLFGHWAALQGNCDLPNIHALDTGCVWGNALTALCLDDKQRYSVKGVNRVKC